MSRRKTDDAGMMLIELVVGMVLMSIVGVMVLNGIISGFKGQRALQDRGEALAQARTAIQRVTREIREADPILSATATSITIRHATNDGGKVVKTWSLVTANGTSVLKQYVTTTSAAGVATISPEFTVISNISATTLPFSYNPVPGWTAPTGSTVTASSCAIAGYTPTAYAPGCIGTVSMHVSKLVTGHTAITVDTTIDLRNVS